MQNHMTAAARRRHYDKCSSSMECGSDGYAQTRDKHGRMRAGPLDAVAARHWAEPVTMFETREQANGCNDSDTLLMAEWGKHNELCLKHFGDVSQWWDTRTPAKIQDFLRDFFDKPMLKLTKIQKMYNVSSGFPIWHFQYNTNA